MKINVETREGRQVEIEGSDGWSIMTAIRNGGVDELEALCGGQLTCATCHIYVDDRYLERLPPKDHYEEDMLDSSDHHKPNSRLACQILCSDALDGMSVIIAPEN